MTLKPPALVWTDGSCAKTGHGGWAALVVTYPGDDVVRTELTGAESPTTSNRMEMRAAIEGMKFFSRPHQIHLVSDSAYLLNTLSKKWYENWGRKKEYHRPNWDLWQMLIELTTYHDMHYVKTKGHADDPYNNLVDQLAVQARMKEG